MEICAAMLHSARPIPFTRQHHVLQIDRPLLQASQRGYTTGMKTAISLPDAVFRAAERQATRSGKSRSQLYAEALAEYLSRHAPDEVTEAMNRVIDQVKEPRDVFVRRAGRSALERAEW